MRSLILLILSFAVCAAEHADIICTDITLDLNQQPVELRVRAPKAATGPCPVILFSHGLAGSREGYGPLAEAWAAAGFVVIQPNHAGSDLATMKAAGAGWKAAIKKAAITPANYLNRPILITTLIDHLTEIRAAVPEFHGSFDEKHLGVGGHSFGAWTTLVIGGLQTEIPGQTAALSDPRPIALLALSSPGPRETADNSKVYLNITRPVLVMTGTEDRQPDLVAPIGVDHGPAWREAIYTCLPAGDKFLAVLTGAHHSAFGCGGGAALLKEPPPEPWMVPALQSMTTTWWKAWLTDDAAAKAALRNRYVVPVANRALVRWEKK